MISCNQERKLGDRRRSDTVVVSTVNYANQGLKEEIIIKKKLILLNNRNLKKKLI